MDTKWTCGECDHEEPSTGSGGWKLQQHCSEEHNSTPKECDCWLIDKETGERLIALSPRAHAKARKEGWYTDEADAGPDKWEEPEEGDREPQETESQRQTKAPKGKTASKSTKTGARAKILGREITLEWYTEVIFREAVLSLMEYRDFTDATCSKFINDCVAMTAERLGLASGKALAEEIAKKRQEELEQLEQEQEAIDDGEEVSMATS